MLAAALGALALLATPSLARAQTAQTSVAPPSAPIEAAPAPMVLSSPPNHKEDSAEATSDHGGKPHRFGGMFDVGVPDGAMLSFVYRPIDIARFHAGLGYNGVSPGLRLGGAYLPFGYGPSLSLEYGHYFEGDANGLVKMVAGPVSDGKEVLQHIGYDFVALRAGIEFGGDHFKFFTRGGLMWMRSTIHDLNALLDPGTSNTTVTVKQDPIVTAFAPTLNLGFIITP